MDSKALFITAAALGFVHTALGPDHYVPFVAMAKARSWSYVRTAVITSLSGLGHILSSVMIGLVAIWLGTTVSKIQYFESVRGGVAGWLLLGFGVVYTIWGVKKAVRGEHHSHGHSHGGGESHFHAHAHINEHAHIHGENGKANITPWILFTLLVFGPCEPLIPVLMYPALKASFSLMLGVTAVFGVVTIATMLLIVSLMLWGVNLCALDRFERYSHALAGAAVLGCGVAVVFLGM